MINIFYILKILLTIFLTGYGFSSLFMPEKLRRDSFFPIFWVGIILSVIFSVALTTARIPLSQGKYVILALSLLLLIYSAIKKKILINFSVETLLISIFTLICLSIIITKSGLIGSSYIKESQYLIGHSLTEDLNIIPYNSHLRAFSNFQKYGFKLGNSLFLGFVSNAVGVNPNKIYSILTSVLFSLTFPLSYFLIKNIFKKINKYLLMVVFLILEMISVSFYKTNNEFFITTLFLGIFSLILILLQSYFSEEKNVTGFFNSYDFLIALSVSSICSIYPDGLIAIFFLFVVYYVLKMFSKKNDRSFLPILKILLLVILINPITFGLAIKQNYKILLIGINK